MGVQISVAKVKKYATHESGDAVEIVERPGSGMYLVMADGQSSGCAVRSFPYRLKGFEIELLERQRQTICVVDINVEYMWF